MNIFISWSGQRSKRVAEAFHERLKSLFMKFNPQIYISTSTEKGVRWNTPLTDALDQADFGILCMTKENCANPSPWMMYEAGVLSKTAGPDHVMPFLLDVSASDVPGPINQTQSTIFHKEDEKDNNKKEILSLFFRMYRLYEDEKGLTNNRFSDDDLKKFIGYFCDPLLDDLKSAGDMDGGDETEHINEKILSIAEQTLRISRENHAILKNIFSN